MSFRLKCIRRPHVLTLPSAHKTRRGRLWRAQPTGQMWTASGSGPMRRGSCPSARRSALVPARASTRYPCSVQGWRCGMHSWALRQACNERHAAVAWAPVLGRCDPSIEAGQYLIAYHLFSGTKQYASRAKQSAQADCGLSACAGAPGAAQLKSPQQRDLLSRDARGFPGCKAGVSQDSNRVDA